MKTYFYWQNKALEFFVASALAIMVVLVFGNVVLRYGFNSGITVSEELSRWLFIWGTFLGAVVALHEHGHLGVDMVVARLPRWGKRLCLVTSHALMLFIVYLILQGSWEQTKISWDMTAPTTGWSMAFVPAVGLVFSAMCALVLFTDLWRLATGQVADDELVMVQESEEASQLREVLAQAGAK